MEFPAGGSRLPVPGFRWKLALDEVFDKRDALRDYPQKEDDRPSVLAKLRSKTSNLAPKPHAPDKEQVER